MRHLVFLGTLVCALLLSSGAGAETTFWKCTGTLTVEYKDGRLTKSGVSKEIRAKTEAEAVQTSIRVWSDNPIYPINPVKVRTVTNVRCVKPTFSEKKLEKERKPSPSPPIPVAKAVKPEARLWTCRVKLTWQIGARKGSVDETWVYIEAASEAAAMGEAIRRSQERLKARELKGVHPAWPSTDAKCS